MAATSSRSWFHRMFPPAKPVRREFNVLLRAEQLETRLVPAFVLDTTLAVHAVPFSITTGDFNGDGKNDIAVIDKFGSQVSVYLQTTPGHFAKAKEYDVGVNANGIAVADVNGDGKLDIITSNRGVPGQGGSISVLLGLGTGKFKPAKTTTALAGTYAYALRVADVNGDGKLDVITADGNTAGSVTVRLGNGNGTFKPGVSYGTDSGPLGLALGDVNGDGKLDIVSANIAGGGGGSGNVSVLLGNGNGTFGTATNLAIGAHDVGVQLLDLNGDGKLDLVTTNNLGTGSLSVALGNGNGTFGTPTTLAAGSYTFSATSGDVNGDGKVDLIAASPGDNTVKILLGNGNGTFHAATNAIAGTTPLFVAVADLNGDGKPDLAVSNYSDNTVSVLTNTYPSGAPSNILLGGDKDHHNGSPLQVFDDAVLPAALEAFFSQDHHSPDGVYVGGTH